MNSVDSSTICRFFFFFFFFSSRRRHTRLTCDWSSDVCSSDLRLAISPPASRKSVEPAAMLQQYAQRAPPDRREAGGASRTMSDASAGRPAWTWDPETLADDLEAAGFDVDRSEARLSDSGGSLTARRDR